MRSSNKINTIYCFIKHLAFNSVSYANLKAAPLNNYVHEWTVYPLFFSLFAAFYERATKRDVKEILNHNLRWFIKWFMLNLHNYLRNASYVIFYWSKLNTSIKVITLHIYVIDNVIIKAPHHFSWLMAPNGVPKEKSSFLRLVAFYDTMSHDAYLIRSFPITLPRVSHYTFINLFSRKGKSYFENTLPHQNNEG